MDALTPTAQPVANGKDKTPSRRKRGDSEKGKNQRGSQKGSQQQQQQQSHKDKQALVGLLGLMNGRIEKLMHIQKLFLQFTGTPTGEGSEEALEFILGNPDNIVDKYGEAPLLEDDVIRRILEDTPKDELEKVARTELKDVKWENHELLFKWVAGKGLVHAVKGLQKLKTDANKLESRINAIKKAPTVAPMGGSSDKTPQKKSSGAGKNQAGGSAAKGTPAPTSKNAFAWSSFQNSPDPKSIPIPSFLTPTHERTGLDTPLKSSSANKFGIPSPPPPPQSVRRAAAKAANNDGKTTNATPEIKPDSGPPRTPSKNNRGDSKKRSATPKAKGPGNPRQPPPSTPTSKKGWKTIETTTNPITPSPIRGSTGSTQSKAKGSDVSSNVRRTGTGNEVTTADSLNNDATNNLRQILGLKLV